MKHLTTTLMSQGSDAKGRNGYFRLYATDIYLSPLDPDGQTCHVEFRSFRSRAVGSARLQLTQQDLRLLHAALGEALAELDKAPKKSRG